MEKRQQHALVQGIVDCVAPSATGRRDAIGAFAGPAGLSPAGLVTRYEAKRDDYEAIMLRARRAAWQQSSPSTCTPKPGATGASASARTSTIAENDRNICPAGCNRR